MTRGGHVRVYAVLLTALALAGSANAASAQVIEDTGGRGFELLGSIGLLTPVSSLVDDPESFGATVNVSVAWGLDGMLWTSEHFGVGLTGWYSGAKLQVLDTDFQGAVPDDLGDITYLTGTVQAVYRFRGAGSRSPIEPYLAAGGGVRYLGADEIAAPQVVDSTDPAGTIAGGFRVDGILADVMIRLEIRDNISFYKSDATGESKLQNDLILSFGFGYRFP